MIATVIGMLADRAARPGRGHRRQRRHSPDPHDLDHKQAFEAAKAGIDDYAFHLNTDNSYWANCTDGARTQRGQPAGLDHEAAAGAGNTGATYAIELIPADRASRPVTPIQSPVDAA